MTETMIHHKGTHHEFKCSLTVWKLYEDLIRGFCSGKTIQINRLCTSVMWKTEWVDTDTLTESNIHLYRIKPKDKDENLPKQGEVWQCGRSDKYFLITDRTEKDGMVVWLDDAKMGLSGHRPDDIVNKNYSKKVADNLFEFYMGKDTEGDCEC